MKKLPLIVIITILVVAGVLFIRGSRSRNEVRNTDSIAETFERVPDPQSPEAQTIFEVTNTSAQDQEGQGRQEDSMVFSVPPSTEVSPVIPPETTLPPPVPVSASVSQDQASGSLPVAESEESSHTSDADLAPISTSVPESEPEPKFAVAGEVIAGQRAALLEFNAADYQDALNSDKLIMLYFFASWCPICKNEFISTKDAFDELLRDDVVGFRVHHNDSSETKIEKDIARQYGVTYQHTKVFIKNGEVLLMTTETWPKGRYLSEINKLAAQ